VAGVERFLDCFAQLREGNARGHHQGPRRSDGRAARTAQDARRDYKISFGLPQRRRKNGAAGPRWAAMA
jgi:hypothetical protein